MNHNILYVFVLLFSTVYSTNLAGCRKIGEISNNINNQPLYSTGLYMCLELSDQNLLGDKINNNLVFSETNNLKPITNLSTSKILNSKNLTNTTNKFNASYISDHLHPLYHRLHLLYHHLHLLYHHLHLLFRPHLYYLHLLTLLLKYLKKSI